MAQELPSLTWTQVKVQGELPSPRNGHTATLVKSRLYILGGKRQDTQTPRFDVAVIDLHKEKAQHLSTNGSSPVERWGHATCYLSAIDSLLVFGGFNSTHNLGDTYLLDLKTLTWTALPSINETPHFRAYHSLSSTGGTTALLFGGGFCAGGPYQYYNDVVQFSYDVHTQTHSWQIVQTTGTPPSPRSQHGSLIVGNAMFINGGYNSNSIMNDLYRLDLSTFVWTQIDLSATLPSIHLNPQNFRIYPARMGFCSFGTTFVVFGQDSSFRNNCVYVLDKEKWKVVPVQGDLPPSTANHTVDAFGLKAYQFGGISKNNQLYSLDILPLFISPDMVSNTMKRDMAELLRSGKFSDVTVVVQGQKYLLHKCMLYTRSPYFRAMFDSGMAESSSPTIELRDISAAGFQGLLEYVYCGETQLTVQNVNEILETARFLGVEELVNICQKQLFHVVSSENVLDLLQYAHLHSLNRLEAYCLAVAASQFNTLQSTPEFLALPGEIQTAIKKAMI